MSAQPMASTAGVDSSEMIISVLRDGEIFLSATQKQDLGDEGMYPEI